MTASEAQIAFYGLPKRPNGDGAVIAHWADMIHHARQRICDPGVSGSIHISSVASPDSSTWVTDPNWSGIAVTNGGFNYAFADWIVPCYGSGGILYRQLQWVGLGNTNLWQGGTETDAWNGYRFWYEFATQTTGTIIYAGPPVGCGDHVAVQVDYNYTVANQSYVYMSNYSKNKYWSTSRSVQPGSNQAEWIVERTQCGDHHGYALQQTGQTDWSYVQAATAASQDHIQPAGAFNYQDISMYENGTQLAETSGLFSDQKSFDVYIDATGTSQC